MNTVAKPSKLCRVCGSPGLRNKRGHVYPYCLTHWGELASKLRTRPADARYTDKGGYVHLNTPNGFRAEHRLVMEQKLGRALVKGESVHHINGIRDDNRPDNLELWLGPIRYGQRAADIVCPHCAKPYLVSSIS